MRDNTSDRRLLVVMGVAAFWVAAIGLRLVRLQVTQHDWLLGRAEHQQQASLTLLPVRGVIYDRNGRELARSIEVKSLYAAPAQVKSPRILAARLAPILGLDRTWILDRLKMKQESVAIKRKLSDQEMTRVNALHEPGLQFVSEQKRFYVDDSNAAQTIGFVDIDERGKGGVELSLDKLIRGEGGRLMENVDALKKAYDHQIEGAVPGANITLTLDSLIQAKVEKALAAAVRAAGAKGGTVVIIRPATGEILAMADYPTFDPNDVSDSTSAERCNRAIENAFEPGSIFKLVTYAAALDEGLINQLTPIDVGDGEIKIGNHIVRDENRGTLTATRALAKSSNIAAIKLGQELGARRLGDYIDRFGFGKRTGIDLPGESRGLLRDVKNWNSTSLGAIPMGYEVGITAIQAAAAFAAIANGGEYVQPYLVSKVTAADGEVLQQHRESRRRVVSSKTAAALKNMLEGVIIHGTGKLAEMREYSAAGKTGTAHKIDKETGRYSPNRYTASFAGFAPVENPQIAVIVSIDEPQGRYYGGDVAAPVFARVASETLQILGVPPESEMPDGMLLADLHDYQMPEVMDEANAGDNESSATVNADPVGSGETASSVSAITPGADGAQSPPEHGAQPSPDVDEADKVRVPDLRGRGIREAADICASLGLRLKANGEGLVAQQTPAPGTLAAPGAACRVSLSRQTTAGMNAAAIAVRLRATTADGN